MDKRLQCYEMVKDCLTTIVNGEYISIEKAFDKFLNYCAVGLYLGSDGVELKAKTLYALDQIFDLSLLKEVESDVIGSVYYDIVLLKEKVDHLSAELDDYYNQSHLFFPKQIFVSRLDTAEYLIGKSKSVMVYTTSTDLTTYRISIINKSLHDLSLFSLFIGDKNKTKLNLEPGSSSLEPSSSNWEFANRWKPVKICHLK